MTLRVTELFLVAVVIAVAASLATLIAEGLIFDVPGKAILAVPWGVLVGALVGAIIGVGQHVTGFTFLRTEEDA